ncbi:hypothetical protein HNV12_21585 [Methanococcoides sp. SA1]|nr:hypothetical protein [Methanococcoides sp. SA1]
MSIGERIVIGLKARELNHHLVEKMKKVYPVKPFCAGKRDDSNLLRLNMWEECC